VSLGPGETILALLVWGSIVGVDLVSFPQGLLSRPLIVGAVSGFLLGSLETGLRVGLLLELFALDVLPVGAARYPDYGAGTVGAVLLATAGPWQQTLGLSVLFALAFAVLGGLSLQWLRQANGRALQRGAAGLAAGDARTVAGLQHRGVLGDLFRSALLAGAALAAAQFLHERVPLGERHLLVTAVAIGAGVAAAVSGAIRSAGRSARLRWLAVGTLVGLIAAVLR
jgi:mannose/fructose/N-acetylgalactosamine-specific phosphotransferase system component IIC